VSNFEGTKKLENLTFYLLFYYCSSVMRVHEMKNKRIKWFA